MKRILNFVGLLALLSSTVGCTKKYGYDFENGFEIGNIADSLGLEVNTDPMFVDRSKYTQARLFPGLVGDKEPRLSDHKVIVDLNYVEIKSSDLRISVAPGTWQSTSMYAPAGELVTIEVPIGIYGLTAQIGAHVATSVEGIDFPQRDPVIFSRQVLFPGKNYLRNLYGGLIYILPSAPLGRQVELMFSGVAKAPSFKLGITDPVTWFAELKKSTVPWFELEGNRIVFTMQTQKAKEFGVDNPQELMETWDKAIKEGYWDWTGMVEGDPDPKHRAPFNKWRIVHDVLFKPGVAQVSGYPVRAGATNNYFMQATGIDGVKNANWGTYHELGHNMQMGSTWSFAGNGEVTNNLFHFKVSQVFGHQSYKIAEVWNKAVPYIAEPKAKSGENAMNWSAMFTSGNKYYGSSNDIALMMYAQIFEKYGYDFMTYIYKRGRNARFTSANDQSKVDFFYEALSEFTETDMEPYLNQWGLFVSSVSKRYVSQTKGFPILNRDVWNFNPVTKSGGNNLVELSKAGWTATANSEDASRPASRLIDGNLSNNGGIWHPGSAKPNPYVITITTGASAVTARSFSLMQRPSGATNYRNHVRRISVEISNDNVNYTALGTYDLLYANESGTDPAYDMQVINFHENASAETFRYIRFKIAHADINGDTNNNAVLTEIGLL